MSGTIIISVIISTVAKRLPKKRPSDGSYLFPTSDISAQPCKTIRRRNWTPWRGLCLPMWELLELEVVNRKQEQVRLPRSPADSRGYC